MTSEEYKDESEPEETCRISQMRKRLSENNNLYGIEMKTNGEKTINTGCSVTIIPNNPALYTTKNIQPLKERWQDVNKNEIKLPVKIWVDVE